MNNFQAQIQNDIRSAQKSIKAAVSWMTDPVLINELADAAKRNVDVKVVLSNNLLNIRRYELFQRIMDYGGIVNKKGSDEASKGSFMHTKFYIIDDKFCRSGSYNWSKKATTNDETLDLIPDLQSKKEHFDRIYAQSVNFFHEISNPEEKKAELMLIEQECEEELTPEILQEYKATQATRLAEEAKRKSAELERQMAEMRRTEEERKRKEQDQKKREEELRIKQEEEKKEREKVEAAKKDQEQYHPKPVKKPEVPPTTYAGI